MSERIQKALGELGLENVEEVAEGLSEAAAIVVSELTDDKGTVLTDTMAIVMKLGTNSEVREAISAAKDALAELKDLKGSEYPATVRILATEVEARMKEAEAS